jgi:four helix bundle protein
MRFDCLDASYQLIRDLRGPLTRIRRADGRLHTQLRTASASIALNIAEGRGRDGKDRRHHWRIARGSAEEVGAILRVAEAFGDLSTGECRTAHETLTRILKMLWKMTH